MVTIIVPDEVRVREVIERADIGGYKFRVHNRWIYEVLDLPWWERIFHIRIPRAWGKLSTDGRSIRVHGKEAMTLMEPLAHAIEKECGFNITLIFSPNSLWDCSAEYGSDFGYG